MNSTETARGIADRVRTLPALPDTALRLMEVINNPRSTVDQIVDVIKYDQAVTGEVLRLCNSAFFGLARKVESLNDAMKCLGTVKVLQLVMSVHTNAILSQKQTGYGLEPGVLWRHSVAVALGSSMFAGHLKLPNISLAFTAGLLHDVGKTILNEYVAEEYGEIIRLVTEERRSFTEAEHQVLGCSHEEVGALVGERWDLPDAIVKCIRYHHEPAALDPPDSLVDAVYLANSVCLLLGIGLGEDGLSYRADDAVMERHGLKESDLQAFGAQTVVELKRVEKSFSDVGTANHCQTPAS